MLKHRVNAHDTSPLSNHPLAFRTGELCEIMVNRSPDFACLPGA